MSVNKGSNTKVIFFFLILLVFPTIAFANAGSPMMWFGIFHSLVLNGVIGVTESEIVSRFKIPNRMWLIILANYVSMIVGLNYIAPKFSAVAHNIDFWGGNTNYGDYRLKGFFIGMAASFVATLIIEFPFFYLAVMDKAKRKDIILPFVIANAITNIIMTFIYYLIVRGGAFW